MHGINSPVSSSLTSLKYMCDGIIHVWTIQSLRLYEELNFTDMTSSNQFGNWNIFRQTIISIITFLYSNLQKLCVFSPTHVLIKNIIRCSVWKYHGTTYLSLNTYFLHFTRHCSFSVYLCLMRFEASVMVYAFIFSYIFITRHFIFPFLLTHHSSQSYHLFLHSLSIHPQKHSSL